MAATIDIAARRGPRPLEWYAEQRRLFMEAIEPITQLKLHLYSIYRPTLIMDSDGRLLSAAYPDEMLEQIKRLDEVIQQMADQWHQP